MRILCLALVICLLAPAAARAARPMPPRLDDAVDRGLDWLARQQNTDGSFDATGRQGEGPKHRVATTGLVLLAFLSAGHTPDIGRHGLTVRQAADFVTSSAGKTGVVAKDDEKGMYSQGIATLALAAVHGVDSDPDRRIGQREALGRMVAIILKAQAVKKPPPFAGGWRYTPEAADSDISLSGWCALALRAAQDVGIKVPDDAIKDAAAFVRRCYVKEQKGFAYQPGTQITVGSNGTGILAVYLLEQEDRPEVEEALKTLAKNANDDSTQFPYYAAYYATHAAFHASDETWATVSKITLDRLMKAQEKDGGWPAQGAGGEPGRGYRTAMAVLTLTVPYRLLPIYQR